MAMTERLAILIQTSGAGAVVRDFDRVSKASAGMGTSAKTGTKGLDSLGASGLASGAALKAGVAAAATIAAAKLVEFAAAAIGAASAVQEQMTATPIVFGAAADSIIEFAEKSSGALGLSRSEALSSMNVLGSYFKNIGATPEVAATASKSLVILAADVASFRDVSGGVPEVLNRIQSGLRGETEAIERLGVNVSAAAVKTKAAELGLGAFGRELTEGEKVAARYALIIEQTTDAQGDMERTGGSLANQQRKLHADIERLKEEMGTALVPAATNVVLALRGLISIIDKVGGAIGGLTEKTKGLRDFEVLGVSVGDLGGQLLKAANPAVALTGFLIDQGKATDDGAVSAGQLAEKLEIEAQAQRDSATATKDTTESLLDAVSAQRAYDASVRSVASAERNLTDARRDYNDLLKEGAVDEEKVADARRSLGDATRSLGSAQRNLREAQEEYNGALARFQATGGDTAYDRLQDASDGLADASDGVASATERQQDAAADLKRAQAGDPEFNDKLAAAKVRVKDAEQGLTDAQYGSAKAAYDLDAALRTQNTALATNGGAIAGIRSEWDELLKRRPEIEAFLKGPMAALAQGAVPTAAPGSAPGSAAWLRQRGGDPSWSAPAGAPAAAGGGGTSAAKLVGNVVINISQAVTNPVDLAKRIVWSLN